MGLEASLQCWDTGSISGPAQWVKDCHSCTAGHDCSLDLTPGPGTPNAMGRPKRKKKNLFCKLGCFWSHLLKAGHSVYWCHSLSLEASTKPHLVFCPLDPTLFGQTLEQRLTSAVLPAVFRVCFYFCPTGLSSQSLSHSSVLTVIYMPPSEYLYLTFFMLFRSFWFSLNSSPEGWDFAFTQTTHLSFLTLSSLRGHAHRPSTVLKWRAGTSPWEVLSAGWHMDIVIYKMRKYNDISGFQAGVSSP